MSAFAAESVPIVDRPISFSNHRESATREYIVRHYGTRPVGIEIQPRMIVLHWTETPTIEAAWRTFNRETLPAERTDLAAAGRVNVSAHYLVGHFEYLRFVGHPPWLEKDPHYKTVKQDPGETFMKNVRGAVADLRLKPPP